MPRKTMVEAIRDAMDVSMARDDNVVVFGEDVGYFGGVFRCTQGLQQKYGTSRCFDTPISELGIVGVAVGMSRAERRSGSGMGTPGSTIAGTLSAHSRTRPRHQGWRVCQGAAEFMPSPVCGRAVRGKM